MAERLTSQLWARQAMYVILALGILFWQLLPLSTLPSSWAGPDWLIALTLAWAQRRPEFVPVTLIAVVILLADFLSGTRCRRRTRAAYRRELEPLAGDEPRGLRLQRYRRRSHPRRQAPGNRLHLPQLPD